MTEERFESYKEDVCWQYNIRQQNLTEDLAIAGLTPDDILNLRCDDFTFQNEEKKLIFKEVKVTPLHFFCFIEK